MKQYSLIYQVTQSDADGFRIFMLFEDKEITSAEISKMELLPDFTHKISEGIPICPDNRQKNVIISAMDSISILLLGDVRFAARDAMLFSLEVKSPEYTITLEWDTDLPQGLSGLNPLVEVLQSLSKEISLIGKCKRMLGI